MATTVQKIVYEMYLQVKAENPGKPTHELMEIVLHSPPEEYIKKSSKSDSPEPMQKFVDAVYAVQGGLQAVKEWNETMAPKN